MTSLTCSAPVGESILSAQEGESIISAQEGESILKQEVKTTKDINDNFRESHSTIAVNPHTQFTDQDVDNNKLCTSKAGDTAQSDKPNNMKSDYDINESKREFPSTDKVSVCNSHNETGCDSEKQIEGEITAEQPQTKDILKPVILDMVDQDDEHDLEVKVTDTHSSKDYDDKEETSDVDEAKNEEITSLSEDFKTSVNLDGNLDNDESKEADHVTEAGDEGRCDVNELSREFKRSVRLEPQETECGYEVDSDSDSRDNDIGTKLSDSETDHDTESRDNDIQTKLSDNETDHDLESRDSNKATKLSDSETDKDLESRVTERDNDLESRVTERDNDLESRVTEKDEVETRGIEKDGPKSDEGQSILLGRAPIGGLPVLCPQRVPTQPMPWGQVEVPQKQAAQSNIIDIRSFQRAPVLHQAAGDGSKRGLDDGDDDGYVNQATRYRKPNNVVLFPHREPVEHEEEEVPSTAGGMMMTANRTAALTGGNVTVTDSPLPDETCLSMPDFVKYINNNHDTCLPSYPDPHMMSFPGMTQVHSTAGLGGQGSPHGIHSSQSHQGSYNQAFPGSTEPRYGAVHCGTGQATNQGASLGNQQGSSPLYTTQPSPGNHAPDYTSTQGGSSPSYYSQGPPSNQSSCYSNHSSPYSIHSMQGSSPSYGNSNQVNQIRTFSPQSGSPSPMNSSGSYSSQNFTMGSPLNASYQKSVRVTYSASSCTMVSSPYVVNSPQSAVSSMGSPVAYTQSVGLTLPTTIQAMASPASSYISSEAPSPGSSARSPLSHADSDEVFSPGSDQVTPGDSIATDPAIDKELSIFHGICDLKGVRPLVERNSSGSDPEDFTDIEKLMLDDQKRTGHIPLGEINLSMGDLIVQCAPNITQSQCAPIITQSQYPPIITQSQCAPNITRSQCAPIITQSQHQPIITQGQYQPIITQSQINPSTYTQPKPCRVPPVTRNTGGEAEPGRKYQPILPKQPLMGSGPVATIFAPTITVAPVVQSYVTVPQQMTVLPPVSKPITISQPICQPCVSSAPQQANTINYNRPPPQVGLVAPPAVREERENYEQREMASALSYVAGISRKNLEYIDDDGDTLIHIAVERHKIYSLRAILSRMGREHLLPDWINKSNKFGQTPLYCALTSWPEPNQPSMNEELIKELIEHGADVNIMCRSSNTNEGLYQTVLHLAAGFGQAHIVRLLLQAHDVKINSPNTSQETPLHCAISKHGALQRNQQNRDCREVIRVLLDHNADFNAKGRTRRNVLHMIAEKADCDLLGYVLSLLPKDNPERCKEITNAQDDSGNTPLHVLVGWSSRPTGLQDSQKLHRMVEALCDAGAEPGARNSQNKTAAQFASRDEKLVELLNKRKAMLVAASKRSARSSTSSSTSGGCRTPPHEASNGTRIQQQTYSNSLKNVQPILPNTGNIMQQQHRQQQQQQQQQQRQQQLYVTQQQCVNNGYHQGDMANIAMVRNPIVLPPYGAGM